MGILEGKKALVFGVANNRSIAWGIAQALHREGAQLAFSYASAALLRRVAPLAEQVGADFIEQCDLSRDDDLESLFAKASAQLGNIDILIHSVAFANRDELNGPYCATSREGFRMALDISCYSFTAMVRHALPLFNPGSSCLAMTYYGAEKAVPHYNVMGV
ncbi:MAG TPA: SDR family oxidoreductase, partial [Anaerolineales bacterium]|nr:SDR family oxidoreductase [Anaerolineales bacterium]